MFGFTHRFSRPGTSPGTLRAPAAPRTERVTIKVINYGPDHFEEKEVATADEVAAYKDAPGVTWIDVVGVHDLELLRALGDHFGLHALALEDVVNVGQRPKLEDFGSEDSGGHFFIVMRLLHMDRSIDDEQLSLFWGKSHVLTFQEIPGDVFEPVRERIRKASLRIRKAGTDYLTYALLDALVDNGFPILERIGDQLEELEEELFDNPTRQSLEKVHRIKRDLLLLRRVAWPQREVINSLERHESALLRKETRIFLRDCYDHAVQVMDVVETYRDLASGLTDLYLSSASFRMNEVMRVLTVMASIFIPLTFLAGIYGMNFDREASPWNMPELGWYWGYPLFWGAMVALAVGMIVYFRRKGWL